jgi:hypothetical protein
MCLPLVFNFVVFCLTSESVLKVSVEVFVCRLLIVLFHRFCEFFNILLFFDIPTAFKQQNKQQH